MAFKLTTEFLSQEIHSLLGLLVPLSLAYLFSINLYLGALIILVIAAIKEVLIDPYDFEHDPFWTGGAIDFFFYVLGVTAMFGIVAILH